MRRKIIGILVLLYAVTWVGGWITHAIEIKANAQRMYTDAQERDREMAELYRNKGLGTYDASDHLSKNGPHAGVSWCVPILPGILLLDSWYVIGPLWGKGGVKLVLYYGLGTKELVCLWGWIS